MTDKPTYGFECPICKRVSWNPKDKEQRFCGVCGFVDDRPLEHRVTNNPIEFTCQDCDVQVYAFGIDRVPEPLRCATCQWIVDYVPEPERDAYRARLMG